MPDADKLDIPKPASDKEPLKTNVYQLMQVANSTLVPLFPYFDEGAMVPCCATFRGGPGIDFGRFQHFNTVDEVVVSFGSRGGRGKPGTVRVGPKLHLVGNPLDEPDNPEQVRFAVITQRQSIGVEQREEYRFICEKCDRRLFLDKVDATPPPRGKQRETMGPNAPFLTITETYWAAKKFNEDPDAQVCKHCGHVNPPFPISAWGWDGYVRQTEIVDIAEETMAAEQEA